MKSKKIGVNIIIDDNDGKGFSGQEVELLKWSEMVKNFRE